MRFTFLRFSKILHRIVFFIALFALFAFLISAFCHPLMVWTGPQAKRFMPPTLSVSPENIEKVGVILKQNDIKQAQLSQLVPSEKGVMLQVTTHATMPRRYFSMASGGEVEGFDTEQAIWLARYYTESKAPIKKIEFIDAFSMSYPSVNRLLPVYKVSFDTSDNLNAFIYTETNALGALSNDWKLSLKAVFQVFHTWAWLDDYPLLRIFVISLLLLSLLSMLLSGLVMLVLVKRKKSKSKRQLWHRRLGWIVLIPFLGFLFSGIYHLYQHEYGRDAQGMRLGKAIDLRPFYNLTIKEMVGLEGRRLNALNLINYQGASYFRASLAKAEIKQQGRDRRNERYKGVTKEQSSLYYSLNGKQQVFADNDVSRALAVDYLHMSKGKIQSSERITKFGDGYDFRNKRLPVWVVSFSTAVGDKLYIDPRTGILVDHRINSQNREGLSFSWLHKWNFLKGSLGRFGRDLAMIGMLMLMGLLALLGSMLFRSSRA